MIGNKLQQLYLQRRCQFIQHHFHYLRKCHQQQYSENPLQKYINSQHSHPLHQSLTQPQIQQYMGDHSKMLNINRLVGFYNMLNEKLHIQNDVDVLFYGKRVCQEIGHILMSGRCQDEGVIFMLALIGRKLSDLLQCQGKKLQNEELQRMLLKQLSLCVNKDVLNYLGLNKTKSICYL